MSQTRCHWPDRPGAQHHACCWAQMRRRTPYTENPAEIGLSDPRISAAFSDASRLCSMPLWHDPDH
jgi:hypothetical protein